MHWETRPKLVRRCALVMSAVLAFCVCGPSAAAVNDHELDQLAGTLLFALCPPIREAFVETLHRHRNWMELIDAIAELSEMACDARSVQVCEAADKGLLQAGGATRLLWDEFAKYRNGLPKADGQWSVVAICVTSREDNAGREASPQPASIFKHGVKRGDVLKDFKQRGVIRNVDLGYLDDHSNEPPTVAILIAHRTPRREDRKEPKGHVTRISADVSFVLAGLVNGSYRVHVLETRIRNVDDEQWELVKTSKPKSH